MRLVGAMALAGCTTMHRPPPPPLVRLPETRPAPAPAEAPPPSAASAAAARPAATGPEAPAPAPAAPAQENPLSVAPAGEATMLVESDPAGAIIVVDGRPVGKTPLRLGVPATPQGFFRNYLEVRARFVATVEGEESHTTIEQFSPRERVPALLHFTPQGARRTVP